MGDTVEYTVNETAQPGYLIATLKCDSKVINKPSVDYIVYDSDQDISTSSKYFRYEKVEENGRQSMRLLLKDGLDYKEKEEHQVNIVCQVSFCAKVASLELFNWMAVCHGC